MSSDQVTKHVFSPLSVASNNGKQRLILDLRYINSCLRILKLKYEDLRTFQDLFRPGYWIFKFDYKSGYHHIDIFPEHWQYLGFSWGQENSKRFFCVYCPTFWTSHGSLCVYTSAKGSTKVLTFARDSYIYILG